MKTLTLSILLVPFLLLSQPQFTITDFNGDIWDSNEMLEDGITIIVNFYSPSMTCWPSSNSIELLTEAYNQYAGCNKLFFLQVAEWGSESQVIGFLEAFGTTEIPTLIGNEGGSTLTFSWVEWGLQWANELWLIRPDGSYEVDIPYSWDIEQTVLIDALENEGFNQCENTMLNIEEFSAMDNDNNIYDFQGRLLNKKPETGVYIKGGEKYLIK